MTDEVPDTSYRMRPGLPLRPPQLPSAGTKRGVTERGVRHLVIGHLVTDSQSPRPSPGNVTDRSLREIPFGRLSSPEKPLKLPATARETSAPGGRTGCGKSEPRAELELEMYPRGAKPDHALVVGPPSRPLGRQGKARRDGGDRPHASFRSDR